MNIENELPIEKIKEQIEHYTNLNKEIMDEIKEFRLLKNKELISMKTREYKENLVILNRYKTLDRMNNESELATLTAQVMEQLDKTSKDANKKLRTIDWEKFRKNMDKMNEHKQEMNELYEEFENTMFSESDDISDQLPFEEEDDIK